MRLRTGLLLLVFLGTALVPGMPASAQDGEPDRQSTTTITAVPIPPNAVGIGDGLSFSGAVVMTPGETPRELDAYQAATFVQAWLATAYFGGQDSLEDPPPELPVSRVDVTGTWATRRTGTGSVFVATNGTTIWISWPQTQEIVDGAVTSPPEPTDWFRAPDRTIEAFNGTAELIETFGTNEATSSTTTPEEAAAGGSGGSSSSWAWPVAGAAVVALVGGGLWFRRRRADVPAEPG